MKNPLISVCIPVFNGEEYIRECIASVLAQSTANFEVLIIDNCSTDQTLTICNEFTDRRIRILKNPNNVGSIENFNRCIQNASGELFILLPCDDLLERDCLNLLSRGFIDNPSVGIAFGPTIQLDERGKKIGVNDVSHYDGMLNCEKAVRLVAEKWDPLQHPMVRFDIFAEVGGFDPQNGTYCAIYVWLKILFGGWDAYVVSKPSTASRCHENQGQVLFRQGNLKKLSDHYGHPLSRDFYKKNHNNLQFFRFVQFFNRCNNRMFGAHNDLEDVMMTNLVRSHLADLYLSLRHFNLSCCIAEIALSTKLMKTYGAGRLLKLYVSTVVTNLYSKAKVILGCEQQHVS